MTFLTPGWIGLAAAASLLAAAIHFIAWRLPRTVILPTARFVPDEPARRAARTIRPADLALLALRVAILIAGGVAMARPVMSSNPSGRATVITIEWSAAIADTAEVLTTVRSIPRAEKTSFVVFDTTATVVEGEDALVRALSQDHPSVGSLSVGLLAAVREARRLSSDYESVSIVLVSPFTRGSLDEATEGIRQSWPDSLQVRRVAAASRVIEPAVVEYSGTGDDPVLAGLRLARSNGFVRGTARVVRGVVSASDSAWVDSGRVLVLWPVSANGAAEVVDAIRAADHTAIGHFIPRPVGDSGRVVARWVNGRPAAREVDAKSGCIRTIGFDVPDVGDFVLTPSFQRLAAELVGPCRRAGSEIGEALPDSLVASLVAPPPGATAVIRTDVGRAPNRTAAVLLIVAILLLLVELLVRRRTGGLATPAEQLA
jgi:hypothetical protein